MKPVVGVFRSRAEAESCAGELRGLGIPDEKITLLSPGTDSPLSVAPATEAEQPGMGKALGGVVGGAVGVAGGAHAGAAAASLLVPGVGPVLATSFLGAALLGAIGAVGGAAAGGALEDSLAEGVPKDELFVYEDALRRGRSIVIALTADDDEAAAARVVLAESGAESIDAARENWWIGLRAAEQEKYATHGRDFERDEPYYRVGFEAALHPAVRGKRYDEVADYLRSRYGQVCGEEPFRRGYESGRAHYQSRKKNLRDAA